MRESKEISEKGMHLGFNVVFLAQSQLSGEAFRAEVGLWAALKDLSRSYAFLQAVEDISHPEEYFSTLPVSGMDGSDTDPRFTSQFPCVFIYLQRQSSSNSQSSNGSFSLDFTTKGVVVGGAGGNYVEISLSFSKRVDVFRAIGVLVGLLSATSSISLGVSIDQLARKSFPFPMIQQTVLETRGLMLDCSRNAVPTVVTIQMMIRYCALVGINCILLYMEDTYQVLEFDNQ